MVIDIPLPHWRPDAADIANPGLKVAKNVYPTAGNQQGSVVYRPLKSAKLYASTAFAGEPRGLLVGYDSSQTAVIFGGDESNAYKYVPSTSKWVNVSRTGGYVTAAEENWRSITYASSVIATNYSDYPQWINCDDPVQFDDLTSLVRGRFIVAHRGFTILANTYDLFDGPQSTRVRWSALNDPFDWAFSQSTQADFQDLTNTGAITGLIADEDVWVFCQNAIIRMHYIGSPWLYQFSTVVDGRGCTIPQSLITKDGVSYFFAGDGWYSFKGGQVAPIGVGKIDSFFASDVDTSATHKMTVSADPTEPLIYWTYPSQSATNKNADRTLIFNYLTGEWTLADARTEYQYSAVTVPWTIDQLDYYSTIDNIPSPFGSQVWAGGNETLWGLDNDGAVYTMGGPNLPVTIETAEMQISQSLADSKTDRATVTAVRPIFQSAGTANIQIGSKQIPNEELEWSEGRATHPATGYANVRNQARYHSIRVNITGNFDKLSAIQVDAKAAGGR
ncbi:hypothetical protein G6L37_11885 [Agrobacterium rubi]|uniref:hypothetical protein n=1 Tax=Agrobacterium rubi TaxID=28099 RepID=UPI001573D1DD|nr:hypothetical protein [Agrobacterium rubi]NTF06862.1 hypothetical protein [Agrobacterium rubi]NTF19104.1 hypothetical protein [Agrobacterium rubi]NTF26067.1 hypothetical protein [Agrobacterium rubi]